ncbi:hypothetical protein Ancab_033890 [Ancistrocladus abbreviatus]
MKGINERSSPKKLLLGRALGCLVNPPFPKKGLLGRSSGFQVASVNQPCTKGLWLWSAPLKMTALGGTEYNLILIDSEGIDAYDQTVRTYSPSVDVSGTYSTQVFSLVVLLSGMFICKQIGGIDEAALDHLSLVLRREESASELGRFFPVFIWLLRIRESIQALFPDRECFTLVWPLNNESQLQQLDQIPICFQESLA